MDLIQFISFNFLLIFLLSFLHLASTENQSSTEQTVSNETKTSGDTIPVTTTTQEPTTATTVTNEECDNQLITTNVKVQIDGDISTTKPTTNDIINQTLESADPVPDIVDLETTYRTALVKNSSVPTVAINSPHILDTHTINDDVNSTDADLSSLDAALDNLNEQVTNLLDEASVSNVKSDSPDAPLDEALSILNSEVLGLLKESRKIQDELKKASDTNEIESIKTDSRCRSRCGSSQGGNQYFDYSIYRESSQSPPPHPLITYRWEDIRRDKEKVSVVGIKS